MRVEEKKVQGWYSHNKQQAAVLAGGVAGAIVIVSFYGLMGAISGSAGSIDQDQAHSVMLGEEAVLMGRGGGRPGATDV